MKQVVIENPVINSPFGEPRHHFRFTDEGITDEIIEARRTSAYFVPVARPRKQGRQLSLETEWLEDRIRENKLVNQIRGRVGTWRKGGYRDVTRTTASLLAHWTRPDHHPRLFFCQVEAVETAIYITEVARKYNDQWIENSLREGNDDANPELYRLAFKMATGSGKTIVMAMLISWQVLNKLANPQDARFTDAILVVTPGITIRDRLRVLFPNDPDNYYRKYDLLPASVPQGELDKAKMVITNFHAFLLHEKGAAGKLTKHILARGEQTPFTETPDQMVRRVCRDLGNKGNVLVINDEAHHCYRRKPDDSESLAGDERREADRRNEEARVWISGLEAVKAKLGIRALYDLSATPFFLRGSGYSEGTLFPWVVSDFSLIDAIESGIVKVPRVPVADDSMVHDLPTYRNIWVLIRDHLPKKGRRTERLGGEPKLPRELEGALHSLYSNYERYYYQWEANAEARARGQTPPVFIVVCNNTNVSKLVYDYVAGWEKQLPDGSTVLVPGDLAIFSNVDGAIWRARPNTILIDSSQLESGEAMSDDFKKIARLEIDEFKAEYRRRFPGRDVESLTDEELLREVMNTVGKPGKLGEQVRCVVSVSMLTEGWDANTVSHILGVRAFGTQLLCEQVVGRGLRRMSYVPDEHGMFAPEYAEVYGVPFSFIPCSGSNPNPEPGPMPHRVRALPEREVCEITWPRLSGYRYELPTEQLKAEFSNDSRLVLSTQDIPTKTEIAPIVGLSDVHTLEDLKRKREQEVAFWLAKQTLEKYFQDPEGNVRPWLFPQLLEITRRWLDECVTCKDNAFKQLLVLSESRHDAADRIYRAIVASEPTSKRLLPILEAYNTIGSTRYVDFDTTKPVYATRAEFCHVSHVVADTNSWEQKMAQALEELGDEGIVQSYVKNQNLGFNIPYTLSGEEHNYLPDFIVQIRLPSKGEDEGEILNLILEVTGEKKKDKAAKVSTVRNLWVPAVNNDGRFGRWAFIEIGDPWDAKNAIRAFCRTIMKE
jgi:type III restriction enzyme